MDLERAKALAYNGISELIGNWREIYMMDTVREKVRDELGVTDEELLELGIEAFYIV